MEPHGFAQVLELGSVQFDQRALAPQDDREVGCAMAVKRIAMIVVPLTVMKKGEPGKDRRVHVERACDSSSVEPHPAPVRDAVDAILEVEPKHGAHDRERLLDDGGMGWHGFQVAAEEDDGSSPSHCRSITH